MIEARRGPRWVGFVAGLALSLGGALLFAQDPAGDDEAIVGNKSAKVYHRASCASAKKLTARTKVEFASADDAVAQKFKPCPICKPPAASPVGGAMDAEEKPEDGAMPAKGKGKAKKGTAKAGPPAKKGADAPAAEDDLAIKFSRDIAPILVGNCIRCHNPQQRRGRFDLTTFQKLMNGSEKGKVIVPGNPEQSQLILRVRGEADGQKMPPGQTNLAPETIAKLEDWIKAGARLDAGKEPTATLESIAPTVEARRKSELAKLSVEERDKKVEAASLERWKKASSKTEPTVTPGKNFLLFSNLPPDRAQKLLKSLDEQRGTLMTILGPQASGSLSGLEKISLFVFNDVPSYVEFVRSNENREVEQGIEAHGRLDVEQPYLAAADPLNGAAEPAGAATSKATPKKSSRSKKAAAEEAPDGPDRTLAGLLTEQLAGSALTAGGKPPRWLVYGLGAYLASGADPRGSTYYRKLGETAAEQYRLGWVAKANEGLGGDAAPETIRALGFSLCDWMATAMRPQFPFFVRGMLEGGEKLDDVIRGCFGDAVTREAFLNEWGGFIVARSGSRRR